MLSTVSFGSVGTSIGVPGFSLTQRAENVLMNATRSARCCAVSAAHDGMLVKLNPRISVLYRSLSSGKVPVGVERHLKVACIKLRGCGVTYGALSPSPFPRPQWHP